MSKVKSDANETQFVESLELHTCRQLSHSPSGLST